MFEKGKFVVYGNTGVCEVAEVTTLDMKGTTKGRLYYILTPVRQRESKIFTPVDSDKTVIREVLTKDEANSLINNIPDIEELWVSNDKLREEKYKETIRNCTCEDSVKIIKALYLRKQERIAQGKKTTAMDEKYLRLAEENLYAELSISLGVPKEKIEKYIANRIIEMETNSHSSI